MVCFRFRLLGELCRFLGVVERAPSSVGGESGLGMPPGWEGMLIHLLYRLAYGRLSQYKYETQVVGIVCWFRKLLTFVYTRLYHCARRR